MADDETNISALNRVYGKDSVIFRDGSIFLLIWLDKKKIFKQICTVLMLGHVVL